MEKNRLINHLKDRPEQLKEAKRNGTKIIGYFPGNYVPEEIIYAAGAVPLCLTHGGRPGPADAALSVVPQIICPFARAQLGERMLKENPYYSMMDLFVAPITCQHLKKVAEVWEHNGDLNIYKLGIPHQYSNGFEVDYFIGRLRELCNRIEILTGNKITDERLNEAIDLYNRMRDLLKKISLLRRTSTDILSASDFFWLNHASFYSDPAFMVDFLDSVYTELREKKQTTRTDTPRILLVGPNIGYGDNTIPELVHAAGGEIVIEEIFEGIRYYWNRIDKTVDLIHSLAKGYLIDKVPAAFMRYSSRKRLDFVLQLVKDFDISGVIWYELLCCETYDCESFYFSKKLNENNMPMLILESDYSSTATGQIKTRIEAFIEIIKGVI